MAQTTAVQKLNSVVRSRASRIFPILDWLGNYRRQYLAGDILAGIIVAILAIPEGMAYAMIAGMPPHVGLYASLLPLLIYPIFGSSRFVVVGPVAMISLLVANAIGQTTAATPSDYLAMAVTLAFLVGAINILLGVARLGILVNFFSHPVLSGFTSAAAIIIGMSQAKNFLGVTVPHTEHFSELVIALARRLPETNLVSLSLGAVSLLVLLFFHHVLGKWLTRWKSPQGLTSFATKGGPLVAVLITSLAVWGFGLSERAGVRVAGHIPSGLPSLSLPSFDLEQWKQLVVAALVISFVSFLESVSVAKSLAAKRRQKVDANQELIALGAANMAAAFTSGYPVAGSFSRSVVNFSAGAKTGLASMITAVVIGLSVLFLTPLFYNLPHATLAALILTAVATLIDFKTLRHLWRYNKADAAAWVLTFLAVLAIGIEKGILLGVVATLGMFIWRTSKPHIAVVGRVDKSEQFRNVLRHSVQTYPHILAIRVDGSLYFANTKYIEDHLLCEVADRPELTHVVLICSAINYIDASALETLLGLVQELKDAGVTLCLAEVKGPVMDHLEKSSLIELLGRERIFLSTHEAITALTEKTTEATLK